MRFTLLALAALLVLAPTVAAAPDAAGPTRCPGELCDAINLLLCDGPVVQDVVCVLAGPRERGTSAAPVVALCEGPPCDQINLVCRALNGHDCIA